MNGQDLKYAKPASLRIAGLHPEVVAFIKAQAGSVTLTPSQINQAISDYLTAHPPAVKKAIHLTNAASGTQLQHGLGTLLGATVNQFCLELRFQDAQGNTVVGISFTKTDADTCALTYSDATYVFTGDVIAEATKF